MNFWIALSIAISIYCIAAVLSYFARILAKIMVFVNPIFWGILGFIIFSNYSLSGPIITIITLCFIFIGVTISLIFELEAKLFDVDSGLKKINKIIQKNSNSNKNNEDPELKTCPFCAEQTSVINEICEHCGRRKR